MAHEQAGLGPTPGVSPGPDSRESAMIDPDYDARGTSATTHESLDVRTDAVLENAGGERADRVAAGGRHRIADTIQKLGDQLERRGRAGETEGGLQARTGRVAARAGEALDGGAEYLREHDLHEMRDDLERQIRERPIASVAIALGAGFLLARILRD